MRYNKFKGLSDVPYPDFIERKKNVGSDSGFDMVYDNPHLKDFQRFLVEWSVKKGRGANFADCGLGKTLMQLSWAQNVLEKTNKSVLVLTPLAVAMQTVQEAEKFGIEVSRSNDGNHSKGIIITNYEKLHMFDHNNYAGVVCDESSILKSFDGSRRKEITNFMRKTDYRHLYTATAAPNDYLELGTSSEALGYLGHMDMLNRFFKNDQNNSSTGRHFGEAVKWRFKGHSELDFWRWVCSWARAVRYPSDIGFSNDGYILPELIENEVLVKAKRLAFGNVFEMPAVGLKEQREERKRTIVERCEKVAELAAHKGQVIAWCHLNDEAKLIKSLIPDSVEVSGSDSEKSKEDKLNGFSQNKFRVLVTKPKIGAWGMNFQNCNHVIYFPSHSYEQYYQAVRRCWRFGQKNKVKVDVVLTNGDQMVMKNLQRKYAQAIKMFDHLVLEMNNALSIESKDEFNQKLRAPQWL